MKVSHERGDTHSRRRDVSDDRTVYTYINTAILFLHGISKFVGYLQCMHENGDYTKYNHGQEPTDNPTVHFKNLWNIRKPEILLFTKLHNFVSYTKNGDFTKQDDGQEPKPNMESGVPLRQRSTCRTFHFNVPRPIPPLRSHERAS